MPRARLTALALAAVTLVLTGCAGSVSMEPAPEATAAECAEVTARLPDTVAGLERRWTDAQATGAWGSPAAVLLSCGLPEPAATTLPCQSFNGVDWVIDESQAPRYTATTFNRTPAVQVFLDGQAAPAADVMSTLSQVVSRLPANGAECTNRVG